MEVVIISAQGLENKSSLFCPFSARLRPFITMAIYPPPQPASDSHAYVTRVDDHGGENPTWGDKFHVPLDASFFANGYSCLFLRLFTKRPVFGRVQLGWCRIPVGDIGYPPQGSVRYLSYRLRAGDGTVGQGIVNISITLTGCSPAPRTSPSSDSGQIFMLSSETVIGVPVTLPP